MKHGFEIIHILYIVMFHLNYSRYKPIMKNVSRKITEDFCYELPWNQLLCVDSYRTITSKYLVIFLYMICYFFTRWLVMFLVRLDLSSSSTIKPTFLFISQISNSNLREAIPPFPLFHVLFSNFIISWLLLLLMYFTDMFPVFLYKISIYVPMI